MSVYKCRKCGSPLVPQEDQITAYCEYCESVLRLPRVNKEIYNEANKLRMEKRFDQAAAMFRECLIQNPQDSECHWNLLLCKYGVEYVEESDGRRIPTCNGIAYDSILEDDDYIDAVRFADETSAKLYEDEAKRIYAIQQEIIKLAQKNESFDVFLSYKETDEQGGRTEDSVIAQEIYEELTKKGYKVFFSRVTLKGQAGLKYEPIIFSALNSAPVMLLIGTSGKNMESVWVKNEWTRFLNLMEEDKDKKIEVIYKGMERIDLPARLRFVPQRKLTDADKYGWMQDVAYDVDGMLEFKKKESAQGGFIRESDEVVNERAINNLYIRAEQFLENGNEDEAIACLKQATDIEYERAETWWRLFLIYSDDCQDFDESTPEPESEIAYYGDLVLKYAKESEEHLKKGVKDYYQECRYEYGENCSDNMKRYIGTTDNYSQNARKNIEKLYKLVSDYASESVIADAKSNYDNWKSKIPLMDEYIRNTSDKRAFFERMTKEDAKFKEVYDKAVKHDRKLRNKARVPMVFRFSNVLMLLYLMIAPLILKFWEAEGATKVPWVGWTAFGSVVCLAGYLIAMVFAIISNRDTDARKSDTEWAYPYLAIFVCTILCAFFNKMILRRFGKFFSVSLSTNKFGSITEDSYIELFTATKPFFDKFFVFLAFLIVVHLVLAILTKIIETELKMSNTKNETLIKEVKKEIAPAVNRFEEKYSALNQGNLIGSQLQREIKIIIDQQFEY